MSQNVYPSPRPNGPRPQMIIAIALIVVAVLIIAGSGIAYFVLNHDQRGGITNNTTPTTGPNHKGPCGTDSPYGFTAIHADQQLITLYNQLGVCWVRYQHHWRQQKKYEVGIETAPGVYNWSQVDSVVALMNQANIHIDFPIQSAPAWEMTQTCSGTPFLPGPDQMYKFAYLLAQRYDGKHGHGHIDAFEIGNEEYDNYSVRECRTANYYGPVLEAGYKAVKAANPQALVGMFGMWYHNLPHIQDFMTYLYSNGFGQYMDYMNFHYYHSGGDPAVTNNDDPSFDLQWQTMHNIAAKYSFGNKPIWVTETGWDDSNPQLQNQYLQYVMSASQKSHVVQKVFWFTINAPLDPKNINPKSGALPSLQTFQGIVRAQPFWN